MENIGKDSHVWLNIWILSQLKYSTDGKEFMSFWSQRLKVWIYLLSNIHLFLFQKWFLGLMEQKQKLYLARDIYLLQVPPCVFPLYFTLRVKKLNCTIFPLSVVLFKNCPIIRTILTKKIALGLFIAPKCVKSQNQLPFHTIKWAHDFVKQNRSWIHGYIWAWNFGLFTL